MEQVPAYMIARIADPNNPDKKVTTTTDGDKERLDVYAKTTPVQASQPVHEYDGWNNDQTKISYTVPTGKVLYITSWFCAHVTDAGGHVIALRDNGTQISWMSFNNDATTTAQRNFPDNNPYGPIAAGRTITIYRVSGSSPEEWGCEVDGYLEDA